MKSLQLTREMPRLSLRVKLIALLAALIAAVALPQICHVAGRAFGVGTGLGELLLPMHLPILMVGLLAGPAVGAAAGFTAPLISFLLSGMPLVTALPFMCVELCTYGLCTGLLRGLRVPSLVKVLISQVAGRALRMLAILVALGLGQTSLSALSVWTAIPTGLPGLAAQWILIPVVVLFVEKVQRHES